MFFELGSRKVCRKTVRRHIKPYIKIKVHQFHHNIDTRTIFKSICFSVSTSKIIQNLLLNRLLRDVMHKRTSRVTRKKLFFNSYISVKKKCLLEIHHDNLPPISDCCKFISTSSLCSGCHIVKSDTSEN